MEIIISWWVVVSLSIALVLMLIVTLQLYQLWKRELYRRKSQSSRYGKLTEQFLPLADKFPWDPGKFRFLGTPIDGIQFEEDRIILVEFKAADSHLSLNQRNIRSLVNDGKVYFEIVRVR